VGGLDVVILPCSAAHDKTDEKESFLWGCRRPSGLCLEESLASLDMVVLAGWGGRKRKKKRVHEYQNHQELFQG
jgi:hypothetical protein